MSKEKQYSIGDQVVHTNYGVGEIVDIEEKELSGKTKRYYVIETKTSMYWLSIEDDDTDRVRPVASPEEILEVINILEETPEVMQDHHRSRKKRIREAKTDGDILSTAATLRDLSHRQDVDGLNATEQREFERLKNLLINEWAASEQIAADEVRDRINKIFRRHYPK